MKWIRCNNCYCKAETAKEPFTLTKCGHVYCGRCITQAEKQCPICNTVNVPTVRLQEPLDSGVRLYFTSLKDTLEQLIAVSSFQEEQLRLTIKRFEEVETKYTYAKEVCRKLEIGAVKLHEKFNHNQEEYVKKLRSLQKENIQLKFALDRAQNSPQGNFRSTQSSASSSLKQHTCNKRFQQNVSKVSFSTPLSVNTNSNTSLNSDRKGLGSLAASDGIFQIPSIRKVPRSVATGSCGSTGSTPMSRITERLKLDSLMISNR